MDKDETMNNVEVYARRVVSFTERAAQDMTEMDRFKGVIGEGVYVNHALDAAKMAKIQLNKMIEELEKLKG